MKSYLASGEATFASNPEHLQLRRYRYVVVSLSQNPLLATSSSPSDPILTKAFLANPSGKKSVIISLPQIIGSRSPSTHAHPREHAVLFALSHHDQTPFPEPHRLRYKCNGLEGQVSNRLLSNNIISGISIGNINKYPSPLLRH